jgi:hypothetical protein
MQLNMTNSTKPQTPENHKLYEDALDEAGMTTSGGGLRQVIRMMCT